MNFTEKLFTILPDVSEFSAFIPVILLLIAFKTVRKCLSPILLLILLSLATEIINKFLPRYANGSNIIVFNLYPIFEITLLSWFYIRLINSTLWNNIISFITACFCINSIWFIATNPINKLNNMGLALESICVMLFSLLAFYYFMKDLKHPNILAVPAFWVNAACLLFFGGNLFLHVFSNYILKHSLYNFYELWGFIHSSLNICFNILIAIAFWKTRKLQV